MKRILAVFLIFCLLLAGCSSGSGELVVEVQHTAPAATVTEAAPTEEPVTEPPTEAPTEAPTTETATEPTTEPTEAATEPQTEAAPSEDGRDYVLNKSSKKFHYPHCGSVKQMKDKNRKDIFSTRQEIIDMGYKPCKNCDP